MAIAALCALSLSTHAAAQTSDAGAAGIAEALESVVTDVIERSREAVVSVRARNVLAPTRLTDLLQEIPHTSGTGFIFHPDGYVLTNEHTIHEATSVSVTLHSGEDVEAVVTGVDANTDVAVLKLADDGPYPALTLADSDRTKVGQFVISIGNPFSLEYSANMGIVSAKGRALPQDRREGSPIRYQDFIQTNAYMNRGNSGGPLINLGGEVVGMNTLIPTGEQREYAGIGFAAASNLIGAIAAQLVEKGRVDRAWLGIEMERSSEGIRVRRVLDGSPAGRGGLRRGDVITRANGQPIEGGAEEMPRAFGWLIAMSPVGDHLRLDVKRAGRSVTLDVELGAMPAPEAGRDPHPLLAKLGLRVQPFYARLAQFYELSDQDTGVLILRVMQGSAGDHAKLRPYQLISAVDDAAVGTPDALEDAIRDAVSDGRRDVRLDVKSAGNERRIDLSLAGLSPGN